MNKVSCIKCGNREELEMTKRVIKCGCCDEKALYTFVDCYKCMNQTDIKQCPFTELDFIDYLISLTK